MAGTRRIVVGALAGVALAAAGCGQPTAHYVANRDLGAFLKVPPHWEVFEGQVVAQREAEELPSSQAAPSESPERWVAAFDADPEPSLDHFFEQFRSPSHYPTGFVRVRRLTRSQRDEYSLRSLRNELLPLDQFAQDNPDSVDVVDVQEVRTDEGFHGHRTVLNLRVNSGVVTYDQTAMLDPQLRTVYLLAVECSAACYAKHRNAIDDVVASWTVQEAGP